PHCQAQLRATAPLESLRQMLEREIVNTHHHGTRAERWCGELHVQNIDWIFPQFSAECQWNSDQRRVRKSGANLEIGPTPVEAFARLVSRDVDSVVIGAVDLGQRLDQVNGVAFVTSKLRPNSMSIDCDPQSCSPELFLGSGGLGVIALLTSRIALANTCSLTAKSTEVVELGPSHAASFYQIDVVDYRCVKWKNSFYADSKTGLSNSDCLAGAAMFTSDHDAFKSLQSFFGLRFLNPHVNADRIAWLKLWNIITQLALFNLIQSIHFSMLLINSTISAGQDVYVL